MQIKCEYCGSMIEETADKCPFCGATNNAVKRTADYPSSFFICFCDYSIAILQRMFEMLQEIVEK